MAFEVSDSPGIGILLTLLKCYVVFERMNLTIENLLVP